MPTGGPTLLGFDVILIATITARVATPARTLPTMTKSIPRMVPLEGDDMFGLPSAQISKLIILDMMKAPMPIHTMPPPPAIISRSSVKKFCM